MCSIQVSYVFNKLKKWEQEKRNEDNAGGELYSFVFYFLKQEINDVIQANVISLFKCKVIKINISV